MPKDPVDPLLAMDPCDGYRIVAQMYGDRSWLELRLYSGGEPVGSFWSDVAVEIVAWPDYVSPRDRGDLVRLRDVLDSVVRYLNVGGNWPSLRQALDILEPLAPPRALGPYVYYDGMNTEDGYMHVFVQRDGSGGLRWVESSYVDPLSGADLLEEYGDVRVVSPGTSGEDLHTGPGLPGPE